jgi:PhnB protein
MQINPYLNFNGNCEEAMKVYEKVLRGTIESMMRFEGTPAADHVPPDWRKKVMHASLKVGDMRIMASDGPSGKSDGMKGICVALIMTDAAEAERIFGELSKDGKVEMPLQETFWALRFGMFTDRFGTPWMINCDRPA